MVVLVGDIGGTKTDIATAEVVNARVHLDQVRRHASRDYEGLAELLSDYLDEHPRVAEQRPSVAAFAIAGPVADDRCDATNLPWRLDARALESATGLSRVRLLNDLEAIAWSIGALDDDQLVTLQPGNAGSVGNIAVVAPGTGLGQAGLHWDGDRHRPFATEGGHCDFAPTDARELALLEHLQAQFGHVSWERVVSGMGIPILYDFLLRYRGASQDPRIREVLAREGDLAAAVARLAEAGQCPVCEEVMEWFALLLGREVGNVALKLMARGGVYLAGGIPPKNQALLARGGFLQGFLDKGRMRGLLEAMPVRLVLEERCALIGAARFLDDQGLD